MFVMSLQFQVKFVKVRADNSEEAKPTEPNLARELLKAIETPLANEEPQCSKADKSNQFLQLHTSA